MHPCNLLFLSVYEMCRHTNTHTHAHTHTHTHTHAHTHTHTPEAINAITTKSYECNIIYIYPDQVTIKDTNKDTNKDTIIAVAITIVAIITMATIVVIAIMIFIKYRHSKFTATLSESEILLQEPCSSRCVRVVVSSIMDVICC